MNSKKRTQIKEDQVVKLSDLKSLIYLKDYVLPQKWKYFIALSFLAVSSLLSTLSAWTLGRLVDDVLTNSLFNDALGFILLILLFELGDILLMWQGRWIMSKAGISATFSIRKDLFAHLNRLPISFFESQPEGRTVTRLTHDVENMEQFFSSSMGRLFYAVIIFFVSITAMLLTNFKMGFVLTISIIPAVWITFYFKEKVKILVRNNSKANSECNAKLSEYLKGQKTIRSFGIEKWISKNYNNKLNIHLQSIFKMNNFFSWSRPLTDLLTYLPLIILFGVGGNGILEGTFSIGLFVTFTRYCQQFAHPISMIGREIAVLQQAFTSAERVLVFLHEDKEDDIFEGDGNCKKNIQGLVEFKNVKMFYNEDTPVLSGINFSVKDGEKIGLVGKTGSGKTTTMSLLSRIYPFQSGDILIDDCSIKDWNRSHLRSHIGFVSQDVVLFHGSLRENLCNDKDISDEFLMNACEKTGLYKVIAHKGIDFNFEIQEGGENLSIGEKQLISFTRIVISSPSILVLDEATANIDPEMEKIIQGSIEKVMKGRTCFVIAHRIHTLEICDRILVFKDGMIYESGTYEELLSNKGYFYELYEKSHAF